MYWLQENEFGNYQTVQTTISPRATVQKNKYYRVLTIFNPLNSGYFASESCRFYFPAFVVPIISADSIIGLSSSTGEGVVTQYPLAILTPPFFGEYLNGLSGTAGEEIITQYPLAILTPTISTDRVEGLSGASAIMEVKVYDLTGGIVG